MGHLEFHSEMGVLVRWVYSNSLDKQLHTYVGPDIGRIIDDEGFVTYYNKTGTSRKRYIINGNSVVVDFTRLS